MQSRMPLILFLQATAAAAFSKKRSRQLTPRIILHSSIILCLLIIICQLRHHCCSYSSTYVGCSVWLPLAQDIAGVCEVFYKPKPSYFEQPTWVAALKPFNIYSHALQVKVALAPYTSHLTPHTSHLTPHTSHLTPHQPCSGHD